MHASHPGLHTGVANIIRGTTASTNAWEIIPARLAMLGFVAALAAEWRSGGCGEGTHTAWTRVECVQHAVCKNIKVQLAGVSEACMHA